jgi:hypothetical protein
MKSNKLFFTSFFLLFVSNIFGQAAVDIPFDVTDGNDTVTVAVGLDLTATNCIDPQLGEYDIPPLPPQFDVRFDLAPYGCPGKSSYKDYRAPGNPPAFPFTGMIEHTLWWQIASPGQPINITYNLPPGSIMIITDNITGTLLNLGPFTGQGVVTIPGSYTVYASKAFLKMEYDNIVPVELTSFTASVLQNEKAIQLNWTTATETNNSGFEIQKTSPFPSPYQGEGGEAGRGWETIGFVPGFGTTTEPKSYSFIDENITTGIYKYRLKQIDFDGSFTYTDDIEVEVDFTPNEFVLYQNYPNPFNPTTIIKYEIPSVTLRQAQSDIMVTLKVYDVLGNEVATLVNEEKQPGVYEVEFNSHSDEGQNLTSGVYLYKLQAGTFVQTKKMILAK